MWCLVRSCVETPTTHSCPVNLLVRRLPGLVTVLDRTLLPSVSKRGTLFAPFCQHAWDTLLHR